MAIYGKYITEGVILNDKDIYYNKDKFDSGEINLCFITGHSGSGKSTMANNMSGTEVEAYELDDVIMNKISFSMNELKEYGDLIYSFFNGIGKKYYYIDTDIKDGIAKEIKNYDEKLIVDFVNYAKTYSKSHKNTKFVIKGVWLYEFIEPSKLKDYAVYIKGTSALISTIRAAKRDSKAEYPEKKDTLKRYKSWIGRFKVLFRSGYNGLDIEKKIKEYRKYFSE